MKKRIYYHDTDAGGVVYYGNYLKFLEEARTEFLENKGIDIRSLHDEGCLYAVRKCSVNYKAPAKYGDTISCTANLTKITAAQMFFSQKIYNDGSGELLVEADVVLVSLDTKFKACPIPDSIRSKLSS